MTKLVCFFFPFREGSSFCVFKLKISFKIIIIKSLLDTHINYICSISYQHTECTLFPFEVFYFKKKNLNKVKANICSKSISQAFAIKSPSCGLRHLPSFSVTPHPHALSPVVCSQLLHPYCSPLSASLCSQASTGPLLRL